MRASGDACTLELEPASAVAASLDGAVSDARGRPLAGIDVTLHLSPLLVRCDCMAWRERTDERGGFSFGFVADGEHQLTAADPSGRLRPAIVRARPGAPVSIVLE